MLRNLQQLGRRRGRWRVVSKDRALGFPLQIKPLACKAHYFLNNNLACLGSQQKESQPCIEEKNREGLIRCHLAFLDLVYMVLSLGFKVEIVFGLNDSY